MKTMLWTFISIMIMFTAVSATPRQDLSADKTAGIKAATIDNTHYIDANRILMFVTNHGNFGRDLSGVFGYDYGTWFPYTGDTADISLDVKQAGQHSPLYAGGLWIGAVDSASGETRVAIAEYADEYVHGPMEKGSFIPDGNEFRIYKLYSDSLAGNPNADYLNWPEDQGAPLDEFGDPELIYDQMLWSVYNDADPSQHDYICGGTAPLGLEIRQAAYGFASFGIRGNYVFLRWRIYNKGENVLNDCYISIFADTDIGYYVDDYVGCDTIQSLGFAYNADNDDPQYSNMPIPSLGIGLLQGPMRYTGNMADTGRMWGYFWPRYSNYQMTAFGKFMVGTPPDNFQESYNYMQGLNKNGSPYVYNGDTTTFVNSGDPVTGAGDLDNTPGDRGFLVTTGPIDLRPGDSTEVVAVLVFGQGADRLESITSMKFGHLQAQLDYDDTFDGSTDVDDNDSPLPYDFSLSQNYPNPFNPSTGIDFTLPRAGRVIVDVFDLLGRQTAIILDEHLSAGEHSVVWDGKDKDGRAAATGVYFYRLRSGDLVETRKMVLLK